VNVRALYRRFWRRDASFGAREYGVRWGHKRASRWYMRVRVNAPLDDAARALVRKLDWCDDVKFADYPLDDVLHVGVLVKVHFHRASWRRDVLAVLGNVARFVRALERSGYAPRVVDLSVPY
jgi:hypothetical protein